MDGYVIDAVAGVVFGKKGSPIRRVNGRGYVEVCSGGKLIALAHRAIWESVHGKIPSGMEINHLNGIKTDNRICNLELVTPSQNVTHAYRSGFRRADGVHNGRYKHGKYTKDRKP